MAQGCRDIGVPGLWPKQIRAYERAWATVAFQRKCKSSGFSLRHYSFFNWPWRATPAKLGVCKGAEAHGCRGIGVQGPQPKQAWPYKGAGVQGGTRMGVQGRRGKRVQGHRGTPAHARPGGMGAPGGKVRGCMQHGVGGCRGAGVQGCFGNRAPGRRGAMVCVHRDVARSTTGAQKCICFFLEKTGALNRKMNPGGPGWHRGRGCSGFCRQPWLPLRE